MERRYKSKRNNRPQEVQGPAEPAHIWNLAIPSLRHLQITNLGQYL